MNKENVNCVITDLDNTIWDWFNMWYHSFEPYINKISKEFQIDIEVLKQSFKRLHQHYGTTEASYIINDLDCLTKVQKDKISSNTFFSRSIIHEYNSNKKKNLKLYSGIKSFLAYLKKQNVLVIGFTESQAFFTKYRLKHLELDGFFDAIYSPVGYDLPDSVSTYYSPSYWEPLKTEFRYLPNTVTKPAPEILDIIVKDFKIDKNKTIYIGDKLHKDIIMANAYGMKSAYAKYGHSVHDISYDLLREVSHWSDMDIQIEKKVEENQSSPIANFILEDSIFELEKHVSFSSFNKINKEDIQYIVPLWKEAISVQRHFNDICIKIRNLTITFYTFIIGGIGFSESKELELHLTDLIKIPYSSIISFIGFLILLSFYIMDQHWYHKLLIGSVKQAEFIERKWSHLFPEIQLSTNISKHSVTKLCDARIHSKGKLKLYYGLLILSLVSTGIVLFFK